MKKIHCLLFLTCALAAGMLSAPVAAEGWNEAATRYELSDGSYAEGLKTIDGIKYLFDENGDLIGRYTGWTRFSSSEKRNYYRDGRRCAGWHTINGKKYYFYYEGGAAVGDVQIEDKIYTFDENGTFTGETKTPVFYTENVSEVYYADDLPEKIPINAYYTGSDAEYFEIVYSEDLQVFNHIERYENGKWQRVDGIDNYWDEFYYGDDDEYSSESDRGRNLEGRGMPIPFSDDPNEILIDKSYVDTKLMYRDKITAGKYRAVFILKPGQCADEIGFEGMEVYSYFTIK